MKLADGMVLPMSALRIDMGEDDKISLYRVVVMTHAKEDFRNQCSGSLRIQCRDYDEEEINRKPIETQAIEDMRKSLKEKKSIFWINTTNNT